MASLDIAGEDANAPLVAQATNVAPELKPFRQANTTLSVESSCKMYLDAVAGKLAQYYNFNQKYKTGPTIGNVLQAILVGRDNKPKWSHTVEYESYEQECMNGEIIQIKAGDPKFNEPLPEIFTAEEWETLGRLNKVISSPGSATLPLNAKGQP
jgi:hypothetical protein